MHLVLDPGVHVSSALTPRGVCRQLIEAIYVHRGKVVILVSPRLLQELGEVLSRPKFSRLITPEERLRQAELLAVLSEIRPDAPQSARPATRDPKDDYLVDLARLSKADHLVSGDRDLSEAGLDISVLNPRQALDVIRTFEART